MNEIKDIIRQEYASIDGDEPITKALSMMDTTDGIIILRNGKYDGFLHKREISRAKLSSETKSKTFQKNVAKVSPDEHIVTTAALMLESDSYTLPVFDKDKLIGVVTAEDVLRKAAESEFGDEVVNKYISIPVLKINPDDPVSKAIKLFKEKDISRLPVVDQNIVKGIITLDDILNRYLHPEHRQGGSGQYDDTSKFGALMADKKESLDIPVKGFMSESVMIMNRDESIRNVIQHMFKHQYRGMLIGNHENVEGIVTKRDLLEPLATITITEPIVIQFSGELDKINEFNKEMPKEVLYTNFHKFLEYLDNALIHVRLHRHDEQSKGKHMIYCEMRLSSPRGMFVSSEEGWGFMDAINKASSDIERQIRKKKEK